MASVGGTNAGGSFFVSLFELAAPLVFVGFAELLFAFVFVPELLFEFSFAGVVTGRLLASKYGLRNSRISPRKT